MNELLHVEGMQTSIGQFQILEGVSFDVSRGSVTVLLGRNGAGKTTTLRSILGITPPQAGEVTFRGQSLRSLRPYQISRLGIGYVPDRRAIFSNLSVAENLRLAERSKGDLERKADFIFDLFPDLKRLYRLTGGNLSGGQQQMLSIARALVPDNLLLLIDEPSEGLAPVIIEQLIAAMQRLSEGTTILLVEQNFLMAKQLADRYTIIDNGRSVRSGPMRSIVEDRETIQRYLGAGVQ